MDLFYTLITVKISLNSHEYKKSMRRRRREREGKERKEYGDLTYLHLNIQNAHLSRLLNSLNSLKTRPVHILPELCVLDECALLNQRLKLFARGEVIVFSVLFGAAGGACCICCNYSLADMLLFAHFLSSFQGACLTSPMQKQSLPPYHQKRKRKRHKGGGEKHTTTTKAKPSRIFFTKLRDYRTLPTSTRS